MSTRALTLHKPEELLAAMPYLLGFHPQNSLVVLTLREDRLGLTARVDRPDERSAHGVNLLVHSLVPALLLKTCTFVPLRTPPTPWFVKSRSGSSQTRV